jgi:membrane protein implicated in regulation of membrane protease activity
MLSLWWVWLAAALVLAIVEVLVPALIFMGFAIGAGLLGGLILVGLMQPTPVMAAVWFAVFSLLAYVGLRLVFRGKGSVKVIRRDINDDP